MNQRIVEQGWLGYREVPRVGLGCMGMSEFYGPSDKQANLRLLQLAAEVGYVHFDTADMYGAGANEELLGQFIKTTPRDKLFIASKFGIVRDGAGGLARTVDNRPEYVAHACEASLKRLGVETLDLYYMHRRDTSVPIEETVDAMAELVKQGKVRTIGLSEVNATTLRAACKVQKIAAVQTEYSLLSRDPERDLLGLCEELGVAFVAYSPLSRGLLTGSLTQGELQRSGDVRQYLPRFTGENFTRNSRLVDELSRLAALRECTTAQLALAWVLARGKHVHIIPGTRRENYLRDNFMAGALQLTKDEVDGITRCIDADQVVGTRYPEAAMRGINL